MKKRFAVMFAALLCVVLLSVAFSPVNLPAASVVSAATEEGTEARFLNMLNHNFVYDRGFETFEGLTDGAVIANLGLREGDYIAEGYIKGYLSDMYGINAVSFENESFPEKQKEGYVYIVPAGYTKYDHKNAAVSKNEDGTYTVLTDITVYPHDDIPYETTAVSLFAPNKRSSFGYILVYSNINPLSLSY